MTDSRIGVAPMPWLFGHQRSMPAVSQHLKVLKDAGLVGDRSEGARRVYYIDPEGLGELRRWLDQFWTDALESFKNEIAATQAAQGRKKP